MRSAPTRARRMLHAFAPSESVAMRRSLRMAPSSMPTTRSACRTRRGSWLTHRTVAPWLRAKRCRMSTTRWPFSASSALVGSSANSSSGSLAMARAIATRCFAAGQLRRAHVRPMRQADLFQRAARQPGAFLVAHAQVAQRQLDLFQRRERRKQVEALEHEARMVQPEALEVAAAHGAQVLSQRMGLAVIRMLQAGQQRQQRALPQPDGPEISVSSPGYTASDRPCSTCTFTTPDRKALPSLKASRLGSTVAWTSGDIENHVS